MAFAKPWNALDLDQQTGRESKRDGSLGFKTKQASTVLVWRKWGTRITQDPLIFTKYMGALFVIVDVGHPKMQ